MIAEDLQNWYNVCIRERTSGIKRHYSAEDCIMLIERTSQAEAARDAARARVRELEAAIERLTGPMEARMPKCEKGHTMTLKTFKGGFPPALVCKQCEYDAIAARASEPKEDEK